MLDRELVIEARKYQDNTITVEALEEWLAGIDLDDPELSSGSRDAVATLRLFCIEVAEGLREEQELRDLAQSITSRAGTVIKLESPT